MNTFRPIERAVIEHLLAGDHPALVVLRNQFSLATVRGRDFTGAGFVTSIEVPTDAERARLQRRVHLGDVDARIRGLKNGAGFVLFIDDGVISTLEGYTYDEQWPEEPIDFTLIYSKPSRDVSSLQPPS